MLKLAFDLFFEGDQGDGEQFGKHYSAKQLLTDPVARCYTLRERLGQRHTGDPGFDHSATANTANIDIDMYI